MTNDGQTVMTYSYDGLGNGNVIAVTDTNQTVVAALDYGPFGTLLTCSGSYKPRYRFSSKELDEPVGLYYYGYRYYSPELGRWLNRDPIGEMGFRGSSTHESIGDDDAMIATLIARIRQRCPEAARRAELAMAKMHSRERVVFRRVKDADPYSFVGNGPISSYDILGLSCGPGEAGDWLVLDAPFGFNFGPCCDAHDKCYDTCDPQGKQSKSACDTDFGNCMQQAVEDQSSWIKPGWLGTALAKIYEWAVSTFGCSSFESAQSDCPCPSKCD